MRREFSLRSRAFLAAVGFVLAPSAGAAQITTLDEGSFRIWVNGTEAGTETFVIRRSSAAPDAPVIASGEIRLNEPDGPVQLRPLLGTSGPLFTITGYQVDIVGPVEQRVVVEVNGDRLRATTRSPAGQREREYRAAPGTLVLDSGVIHQFYFLARRFPDTGGTVPVVVPRAGRQAEFRVEVVGRETVEIGGARLPARHLRAGQGSDVYDVWADDAGRILRVQHGPSGLLAVREAAPGGP